jgi:hypothetical protein
MLVGDQKHWTAADPLSEQFQEADSRHVREPRIYHPQGCAGWIDLPQRRFARSKLPARSMVQPLVQEERRIVVRRSIDHNQVVDAPSCSVHERPPHALSAAAGSPSSARRRRGFHQFAFPSYRTPLLKHAVRQTFATIAPFSASQVLAAGSVSLATKVRREQSIAASEKE